MRMVDLIEKKKDGFKHTPEEIHFIVAGYTKGDIHESITYAPELQSHGAASRPNAYL